MYMRIYSKKLRRMVEWEPKSESTQSPGQRKTRSSR